MHLRYALLALLSEGEAHGYQLLKLFNQRLGPFWHPNIGESSYCLLFSAFW